MKKGAMKIAPLSVTSTSPPAVPSLNRIRMISAFLRKLSLKAAKNWHQKSGAKRRELISERNMAFPPQAGLWSMLHCQRRSGGDLPAADQRPGSPPSDAWRGQAFGQRLAIASAASTTKTVP